MILALLATSQIFLNTAYEFVYTGPPQLQSVHVAGTFNNWDKEADPMRREGDTWRLKKELPYGPHQYKFVLNGTDWITDPANPKTFDDGNGNTNSVLDHQPSDFSTPAQRGDGQISRSIVRHTPVPPTLHYDQGALSLSIEVRPGDIEEITLVTPSQAHPTTLAFTNNLTETHEATFAWSGDQPLTYHFIVQDGQTRLALGKNGLTAPAQVEPFQITKSDINAFQVPSWVESTVFYQIFPDRFENGDPTNDPENVTPWDGTPTYSNFFGGDLAGVQKRLPHLQSLGINGIYFNPVFKSPANHRYETTDFKTIDPRLGTNQEFRTLVQNLHQNDIKVVLDGVFNHTATNFPPFQEILDKQQEAKTQNWFFIKDYPVRVQNNPNYEAWFGFPSMPKVNVLDPEVQNYFWGVLDYWETYNIDGWRLDVANEVDPRFWRLFRTHLKNHGENRWILGENWTPSTPWLQGDQWDSAMNYPFRQVVLDYVAKGNTDADQFLNGLFQVYRLYHPNVSRNIFNLLGSHDTPRFLYECGDDQALHHLGAVVLLTWAGTPSVYYGDELGMTGGRDPQNRLGMQWQKATPDNPTLNHYTRLIQARRTSKALQSGHPVRIASDPAQDYVAYGRLAENDAALVFLNRSERPVLIDHRLPAGLAQALQGKTLTDALTGRSAQVSASGQIRWSVPPRSGAVLLPRPLETNSKKHHPTVKMQ